MNGSTTATHFCSTSGKCPLVTGEDGPGLWVRGEGPRFWDARGRSWLDFDLCLGSVVWGHGRREIAAAAAAELGAGGAPTIPSALEAKAADILLSRLKRYQAARFFKTGAEACTAAVRLARGMTGRTHICSDGFHGWHDWGIGGAYPNERTSLGVPTAVQALTVTLDPDGGLEPAIEVLRHIGDHLAVAVFRPEAWNATSLRNLVEKARALGAITVCDEVTSHLKYSRLGSAAMLGAEPDLICIGKGLANGMPLAALLGPHAILDQPSLRVSSTNSSETWSLAGMIEAETLLARAPIWPSWLATLDDVTAHVSDTLRKLGLSEFAIVRHPGFFSIERRGIPLRSDPFRLHLVAELGRQGIYTRGWFHGSDQHGDRDWSHLKGAITDALGAWKVRPV